MPRCAHTICKVVPLQGDRHIFKHISAKEGNCLWEWWEGISMKGLPSHSFIYSFSLHVNTHLLSFYSVLNLQVQFTTVVPILKKFINHWEAFFVWSLSNSAFFSWVYPADSRVFYKEIRPLPISPPWLHMILKTQNHHFIWRLLTQIFLCPLGHSELKALWNEKARRKRSQVILKSATNLLCLLRIQKVAARHLAGTSIWKPLWKGQWVHLLDRLSEF